MPCAMSALPCLVCNSTTVVDSRPTASGKSVLALCSYHSARGPAVPLVRRALAHCSLIPVKTEQNASRHGDRQPPSHSPAAPSASTSVVATSDQRIATNSQPRALGLVSGPPLTRLPRLQSGPAHVDSTFREPSPSPREVWTSIACHGTMASADHGIQMVRWQGPGQRR
jgi:hypothetical protein